MRSQRLYPCTFSWYILNQHFHKFSQVNIQRHCYQVTSCTVLYQQLRLDYYNDGTIYDSIILNNKSFTLLCFPRGKAVNQLIADQKSAKKKILSRGTASNLRISEIIVAAYA